MSSHDRDEQPVAFQIGVAAAYVPADNGPAAGTVVCDPHQAALALLTFKMSHVSQLNVRGHCLLIHGKMASGMWSDVFVAQDAVSGDMYALKVVPQVSIAALREEDSQLRGLTHPNIVRHCEEFPLTIDTATFHCMKMELCSKGTLRRLIKQRQAKEKPLAAANIRHYLGQLADALAYVHRRGLLHGDIRAENVLLTAGNDVKLTGFASSTRLLRNRTPGVQLTITGGCRTYAPPEWQDSIQLHRALQPLETPFSSYDMWGLGCVLSELVTLRLVFDDRVTHFRALSSDPDALCALKEDVAGVYHGSFAAICDGLLASDPCQRTEAAALARELQANTAGGWRTSVLRWMHLKPAFHQAA